MRLHAALIAGAVACCVLGAQLTPCPATPPPAHPRHAVQGAPADAAPPCHGPRLALAAPCPCGCPGDAAPGVSAPGAGLALLSGAPVLAAPGALRAGTPPLPRARAARPRPIEHVPLARPA